MTRTHSTALAFAALFFTACTGRPTSADVTDAAAMDATTVDTAPDAPGLDAPASDAPRPWLDPYTPSPRAHFPASFLWGSATAPYQVEGQLHSVDWFQWELMGRINHGDRADDGDRSLTFYADDIRALRETHQTAYRFGIEWARLFPTASSWNACRHPATGTSPHAACLAAADPAGLAYYHTVLDALHVAHITPLVTLNHFTLPIYIDDLTMDAATQGWMRDGIVDDIGAWAGFAAQEFGGDVDWWVTINEPLSIVVAGYLGATYPPGHLFDAAGATHVMRNMVYAHAAMYDAIHAGDTVVASSTGPITPASAAMVSIAHHVLRFYGYDPNDARDTAAAQLADQLFNRLFVEAIVHGDFDANLDGSIGPGEPHNDPALRARADYLGVNYYRLEFIQHSVVPLLHGLPRPDTEDHGLPKGDLYWDIFARGMQDSLMWASSYGVPLVVTENGIADAADINRPRYLAEHLAAVAAAIQQGANVVGYFHWSIIDNFEWAGGFCPKLGLYSVDLNDPARPRVARGSAMLYRSIIDQGEVSDALLAAQPLYQRPTAFCGLAPAADAGM